MIFSGLLNQHHHNFCRSSSETDATPYPSSKMAGIQHPNGCVADADDELQFHIELDDPSPPPPPALTVATFDTYLNSINDHLESSRPAENHALDGRWGSSHEPEPCNPNSLHFIWDYIDTIQPNPRVMAAQAMEALNRTFIELKSKNEDIRLRASYDLRDLVVSAARGKASFSPRSDCMG